MDGPDWPSIDRTVHYRLGLLRFERSLEPSKRKRLDETFDEEVPKTKKIKLSDVLLTEEDIMVLDIDWDKALLERLQPAKDPANHKRSTTYDLLISLPQHHQFTTTSDSVDFAIQREQRSKSEEPTLEACARQARPRYPDDASHLPVEHDDSEMPSKRSHGRKRTHSVSQEDIVDLSNDTAPALLEAPEPEGREGGEAVATDISDTESIVISSRRIKPNSGEKLQELNGTPDPEVPPKTISTGNAGSLKPAADLDEGKEGTASVEGNERDQKEPNETPVPTKKWSYFDNYKSSLPSNIRQFGNPRPAAPVPASSREHRSMAPVAGGPKPVNRLGANASNQRPNPNPQYKQPESRNGYDTSKQNQKAFNLHDQRWSDGQPPYKRQRVEGTPTSQHGSIKSPIDLETESTRSSRQMAPPASTSECNQFKGPQSRVEEFHKVEETVGFAKGKSSSSQGSNGYGRASKFLQTESGKDVPELDDPNDPVSEDEVAVTGARHVKKNTSEPARKSNIEVRIPSSQVEGRTGYRGTANKQPPRQEKNIWRNGDPGQSSNRDDRSKYFEGHFPNARKHQQTKVSTGSHSTDPTTSSTNSARVQGRQIRNLASTEPSSRISNSPFDPDASLDELNSEEFPQERQTADTLLAKQKIANAALGKSEGAGKRAQSVTLDYSSDDALANGKADMTNTTFTSKKTRQGNRDGGGKYEVFQAFSENNTWLLPASKEQWTLIFTPKPGNLVIHDSFDNPALGFFTQTIGHIDLNDESSKMIIHKPRDDTARGSTKIHLQLKDLDQCLSLAMHLKAAHQTIGLNKISSNQLDRIFANISAKLAESKRKRLDPEPESLDIQLAKIKSEQRNRAKWDRIQNSKAKGAVPAAVAENDSLLKDNSKPLGLASSMRTRSSSGHYEDEDLQRPSKISEVSSEVFYGKSTPRRENWSPLHETRSSTRGQERNQNPRQLRTRKPSPPPLSSWTRDHPDWTRDWHSSIIYPAMGKDRARVDMGDVEKLDDGEFLNDNLIFFYLRWLQDQIEQKNPELAKRIYFQNTFFYQKLAKSEKGTKSINYEAVKKWTSKVDLLSKDYIIIPINEHTHWYVAIICNAPRLLPGAEATNSSQSHDAGSAMGDEHIDAEDELKSSSALEAPLKQISGSAKSADVDVVMKDMSLEDKSHGSTEGDLSVLEGAVEGQEVMERDDPPPANVTSDLVGSEPAKPSQTKKSRRKSGPPPRKHNPKEFRIITLDSLGGSHTVTCSNLKDYLVMEIKDKKNIEIHRPGSIGFTAKGIPMQDNYYDCGLFLLSYVEMFLTSPDEFISGILQSDSRPEYHMRDAQGMREHIRKLLFKLQEEQHAQAEYLAKLKGKGKKSIKTEDNYGSTSTSKLSSREASKSTRASPERQAEDEFGDPMEKPIFTKSRPPKQEERAHDISGDWMETRILPKSKLLGGAYRQASPAKADAPNLEKLQRQGKEDTSAARQEVAKPPGNVFNRFLSETSKVLHGLLNHEKPATPDISNQTSSAMDPFYEIEDSPQKMDSRMGRPRSRDPEPAESSRALIGNRYSSVEGAGHVQKSNTRRQFDPQMPRQRQANVNGHRLSSPTPENVEQQHRHPVKYDITDLRSPSPEVVVPVRNGISKAQRQPPSPARQSNGKISTNRGHGVKARSREIMQTPSPGASNRPSSPSVANEAGHSSNADNDDSEMEDNAIQLVDAEPNGQTLSERAQDFSDHDDEMLLPSTEPQDEIVEDADPSLLSSSSPSIQETGPPSRHREGGRSAPSSPNLKYEGRRRSLSSGAKRGTKRKSPGSGEVDNWQESGRINLMARDALEEAIIRGQLQHGRRTGRHIKFDD